MSEENKVNSYEYRAEDEIDLRDVFSPIWQARYRILIICFLMSGLVFGYHLIRYSFSSPSQYFSTVNFNFEGVEKATYPNGVQFSPNDLISNNIMRRVYDDLKLLENGVEFPDFTTAITINSGFYGDVLLKSIAADIASKDKKISVKDFNKLVAEYMNAINTYSRQSAVITFDNSRLHFGQQKAEAVLLKIPEVWAEYSIQEVGVMNVFNELITLNVSSNLGNEPLVMINKLADYSQLLKKSLTQLEGLPRAHSIVEKVSQYSINDLVYKLSQIDKYQVNILRSVIVNNKVYSNDVGLHESFRVGQLDRLHRDKGELVRMVKVYDQISEQFDQMSSNRNSSIIEKDSNTLNAKTNYSPQYGDALVNNLLELGSKIADPEFRKTLLNKKITLALNLQKVETEIEVFGGSGSGSGSGKSIPKKEVLVYIAKAGKELDALSNSIESIVKQYNSYAFNNLGSLYSLTGEVIAVEGYALNDPKLKLKAVIGFILGGMLSVFFVWGRRVVVFSKN